MPTSARWCGRCVPLNNLRVLKRLKAEGLDQPAIDRWAHDWIAAGFAALETLVGRHGAGHCYGSAITLVECYLVPQVYSAERFGTDLSPYPRLTEAYAAAIEHPAVAAAHPDRQPDADAP